jgi:hypothetical protein
VDGLEGLGDRQLMTRAAEAGRPILTSIGQGKAVIHVDLRADQENLASELAARYGSAVELRVGAFSFPGRRRSGPRPPGRPAPEEQAFEGLEMNVEVDQRVLEVGDDGHGRLVLRNSGTERIGPLNSGQPLDGSLLNAAHEAVGGHSGWIAGTGLTVDLAPGQSASIRVIYGTASTREELGYALMVGRLQSAPFHARAQMTGAPMAPRGPVVMPGPRGPRSPCCVRLRCSC